MLTSYSYSSAGLRLALTPLAGRSVLAVLGPVALYHLPFSVISLDGERHAQDVVAGLDDAQDTADAIPLLLGALPGLQVLHQLVLHDGDASVEEALDHLEEVGVVGLVCRIGVATDAHQRRGHRQGGVHAPGGQSAARRATQELPEIAIHDGDKVTVKRNLKKGSETTRAAGTEAGKGRQE